MKFVKSYNLKNQRALEYAQSINNVVSYIKTLDLETLNLQTVAGALEAAVKRLDETLLKAQSSILTGKLNRLDEQRDRVVRAFRSSVKSGLNSTQPERSAVAAEIFFIFNKFGDIASLSRNQETSAIRQLLDELSSEENRNRLTTLHLGHWYDELKSVNDTYEQTYMDRTLELGEKQARDVREARLAVQDAFENFCVVLESRIILEGETAYTDLVAFINNEVSKAKQLSNQRLARRQKEDEEGEAGVEEENNDTPVA